MMPTSRKSEPDPSKLSSELLAWYDRHSRSLPWRVGPKARRSGQTPDPYHVWLSEIMLQQTTVKTVGPYFLKFLKAWPTLQDLAQAETDDVMRAWAGLGYYSRARNLKKCAETIVAEHGGQFPQTAEKLKLLPGIGDYTSAAIAAIAFDEPAAVVDGNVERVISRLNAIEMPLPDSKPQIRAIAEQMTPATRAGDHAQAMMDLGATICSPRRPACSLCPISDPCLGRRTGAAETYPRKAPKREKPVRFGASFALFRSDGAVLMRKRPEKGLLGGMAELPTGTWTENELLLQDLSDAPVKADWNRLSTQVTHTFTHFHLKLAVYCAIADLPAPKDCWWSLPGDQDGEALPTVMRKVLQTARDAK